MAISSRYLSYTIFLLILQLLLPTILYARNDCKFTSIISIGNSITHTGRSSDGRLIIDVLAKGLKLSFIPPYIGSKLTGNKTELGQGVNYAVVGAYALNSSFHEARGVTNTLTNVSFVSLGDQLEWFKQSLPSFCATSSDCKQTIRHSLFLVGSIGGNDYNRELLAGKSLKQVRSFVTLVISRIIAAVNELIGLGGKTLVVPTLLPLQCEPIILTNFKTSDAKMYNNTTGCLVGIQKLVEYQNQLLQRELHKIQKYHPSINVIYADYYKAAMQLYQFPQHFGFVNKPLRACCGGGGPYNYNETTLCGEPSSTTCTNPNTFVNWDEFHLTEAAYRFIYKSVFKGSYNIPRFNSLCPNITS